jgi:hypothetical protein
MLCTERSVRTLACMHSTIQAAASASAPAVIVPNAEGWQCYGAPPAILPAHLYGQAQAAHKLTQQPVQRM